MNKDFFVRYIFLFSLAFLSTIVSSCHRHSVQRQRTVEIDSVTLHQNYRQIGDILMTKGASIDITVEYPKAIEGYRNADELLQSIVVTVFGEQFKNRTLQEATQEYAVEFQKMLEKEYLPILQQETAFKDYPFGEQIVCKMVYCGGNVFSYQKCWFNNPLGAAHPMIGRTNVSYDLKNNKQLKVSDLFEQKNLLSVHQLLKEGVAKFYDTDVNKLTDEMAVDTAHIIATDNFLILKEGISWRYNPYEIACYAAGSSEVLLTWKQLKGLLKKGFVEGC